MTAVARRIWGLISGVGARHSNGNGFRSEALVQMRGQIWREIGRLSFGHRARLCDDPAYLSLLEERGRAICQDGDGEDDPRIGGLVAEARRVEEQLHSALSGSVSAR